RDPAATGRNRAPQGPDPHVRANAPFYRPGLRMHQAPACPAGLAIARLPAVRRYPGPTTSLHRSPEPLARDAALAKTLHFRLQRQQVSALTQAPPADAPQRSGGHLRVKSWGLVRWQHAAVLAIYRGKHAAL